MSAESILIVEDEEDILELVRHNLAQEGFQVRGVSTGEAALREARGRPPNLVVLDLMLPGVDGLDVCRALRSDPSTRHVPIIMLTAKGEESDIVVGLELGADDYITKPFKPRVLVARVRSVLRRRSDRPEAVEESPTEIHGISIHPGRHEIRVDGRAVELTKAEFRSLLHLARRPGWVFTRRQIVKAVHGENYVVTERSVDVLIVGLRRKLGSAGRLIETVRGVGYRFKE